MGNKYNNKFIGSGPRTVIHGNRTNVTIDQGKVTVGHGSDLDIQGDTSHTTVKHSKYKVTINGKRQ